MDCMLLMSEIDFGVTMYGDNFTEVKKINRKGLERSELVLDMLSLRCL